MAENVPLIGLHTILLSFPPFLFAPEVTAALHRMGLDETKALLEPRPLSLRGLFVHRETTTRVAMLCKKAARYYHFQKKLSRPCRAVRSSSWGGKVPFLSIPTSQIIPILPLLFPPGFCPWEKEGKKRERKSDMAFYYIACLPS